MPSKEYEAYQHDMALRYLKFVRSCTSRVEYVADRLAYEREHMDMLKGVSYEGEHVKSSGMEHGDDRVAAQVSKVEDLMLMLETERELYADVIAEAEKVFARLKCHECAQRIMGMRYIMRKRISEVAKATDYSEPRVKEILRDATIECFSVMPHEWRDPNYSASIE